MAMILDAFTGAVVGKLASLVEEKVATVLGVKDELKRLQEMMEMIESVLHDAEKQRISSRLIANWVRNLKDVLYDADDIIDRCRYEADDLLTDQAPSSSNPPSTKWCSFPSLASFCRSVPFRHQIGNQIEELNRRFKYINESMCSLELTALTNERNISAVTRVDVRQTSSVLESDLVGEGIEHATRELVQRMLQQGEDKRNPEVTAVVGMGGIGKTTLARNIFNRQQIQSKFTYKIWVCISRNYSEPSLLAEIIRGAGGFVRDGAEKTELLHLLRDVVSGKRFFLVLDDVWRADVWVDLLQNILQGGDKGSRVLVTTRYQNVARRMGARHIHPVDKLSTESGWQLLCKRLFANTQDEEMQRLSETGIKIVEKCDGLPLAIKTIAGVLNSKDKTETEWQRVLRNEIWSRNELPEELMGALYLSYEDLSSELRQCFLFCSLFEEDSSFLASKVVKYWIVEGFIGTTREDFVEEAYKLLKELDGRNLIEEVDDDIGVSYKMHDVLRSMAQFLSRDESFCGRVDELAAIPSTTKLRRLYIIDQEESVVVPGRLLQQKSLRTLFFKACPRSGISQLVLLPVLRVLVLRCSAVEDVPDSIGDLIHLRLLDLTLTKISSLPESIGNLANLQVLELYCCDSLHILPKEITKLSNLLCLGLDHRLHFVPAGIGSLAWLTVLSSLVVGEKSNEQRGLGCRLEELKPLKQLRELTVGHLERAEAGLEEGDEQELLLRDKQHLKKLTLFYDPENNNNGEEEMIDKIEKVFRQLAPPEGLETLWIEEYPGRSFPNWMMPSSPSLGSFLPCLTKLTLDSCRNIQELPPLGTLFELRYLYISGAYGVVKMRCEFFGSNPTSSPTTVFFPKLEELYIKDMPNLEDWSVSPELLAFKNLRSLEIQNCPKLKRLPSTLKQSPMQILDVSDCGCLESICDLPAVRGCPSLESVGNLNGLRKLVLKDGEMRDLPEWLLRLLQQRRAEQHEDDDDFSLELECHEELVERCLEGCEYWSIIKDIPRVSATSVYWYMAYTKKPMSYETNLVKEGYETNVNEEGYETNVDEEGTEIVN